MLLYTPLEQFQIVPIIPLNVFGFDFSFTNLFLINIISILGFIFIIYVNSSNKNYLREVSFYLVPNAWQKGVESISNILTQVLSDTITKDNEKYFPFILILFHFILFSNLIGLIGLIPYSFTVTSHLIITFILSFSIFIGINIITFKKYKIKAILVNSLTPPISLTYAWSFESLAGIVLLIQMLTGVFLSMHYTDNIGLAFKSIEYIMRDVPNGSLIRYIHANGVSMFFIVIYRHACKGLYDGSYKNPRQLLWCSGVVLLFLMMATAFTGYVLPWGQMSLWGATVITSTVTAIPIAGKYIFQWLWCGYAIKNSNLIKFYTLHFVLPFLIAGFTLIHIALLHKVGSSSPVKSNNGLDDVPFYPYFVSKDLFAFLVYFFVLSFFVLYYINFLNNPINDISHKTAYIIKSQDKTAYILKSQILTIYYFFFFLIIILAAGIAAKSLFALNFKKKTESSISKSNLTQEQQSYLIIGLLCLIVLESFVLDHLITCYVCLYPEVYILKEQLAHFYRAGSALYKVKESMPDDGKPNLYLLIPLGLAIGYAFTSSIVIPVILLGVVATV